MLRAFINIFKIPELRNKLFFTMGMLVIYRLGFWIALPGINSGKMAEAAASAMEDQTAFGSVAQYISIFTGGSFSQSSLFGLGIMPYISASIIFQLLGTVLPSLEQLQKEGPAGRQKIQEYTRYATIPLCIIQAMMIMKYFQSQDWVYAAYTHGTGAMLFWTCGIVGLTGGTVFLMWLGEQIDKYGIGSGASLIITAGIVARMPSAFVWITERFTLKSDAGAGAVGTGTLLFLMGAFVVVVGGCILITQGQRRIPVQQAKHTRGRRVYGGQRSYLPLRVNHGGVMPIIFASSLMMVPTMLFGWMVSAWDCGFTRFLNDELSNSGGYLYTLVYVLMIIFFAFFWTTVQFQPREVSIQLRDNGSFIPGLRPGPRTAEYLERVMERITYVGAGFLALIAVIPTLVAAKLSIPFYVSSFLGGTGLLITVSVSLDFIQRIEASLLMRNYGGFLSSGPKGGKGPRIRGAR